MNLCDKSAYFKTIVLCMCVCLQFIGSAQQDPRVELLTTNDGLAQGMIYDVIQDQEGFIWFATKDGLNRYDGHEFKAFTNDPSDPFSISGNTIVELFEDSKGRIWASSNNAGINIYDKKSGHFHRIQHDPQDPTSLSGNNVSSILEDTSGYFICVVDKRELNMFKVEDSLFEEQVPPKVIRVSMPSSSSPELRIFNDPQEEVFKLNSIVKDAEHRIWVAGLNTIYELQVGTATLSAAREGLTFFKASAGKEGAIWAISDDRKLYHWGNEIATLLEENRLNGIQTIGFYNGNLWVLTMTELFGFHLSGGSKGESGKVGLGKPFFHWVPDSSETVLPFIRSPIHVDRSGLIWIGLGGYGVLKVNPKTSRFSNHAKGRSVCGFYENEEGVLYDQEFSAVWRDVNGNCLDRAHFDIPTKGCFSADIFTSDNETCWVKNKDLYSLDSVKSVYMLRMYNLRTKQSKDYELSWHLDILQPMMETADGSLWLAGFEGMVAQANPSLNDLIFYDLETGRPLDVDVRQGRRNPQYGSTAIYEDIDKVLWIATERGFYKCIRSPNGETPLRVTSYTNNPDNPNSLSYNHVTSFFDDPKFPKRYLWVSTKGGGLNRFDKQTGDFLRLTKDDGLPNNVVYGVLSDAAGNVWGSTNKGLFCMSASYGNESALDVDYSFRNFSVSDGLQENEFNTGAFAKLSGGRLAFGGVNGYSVFVPEEVLSEEYSPNTYITNILVNNQVLKKGDSTGVLESTIQATSAIKLSDLDNVLTLEFASLDFTAADQNRYRYQFINADQSGNWVDAGNRRSATFLNLQPNDYVFRVQGSNSHGVWNGSVAELRVSVLPPWWKTWWAYLFYASLLLAAVLLYFRISVNREKLHQQLNFEKREAERAKELDGLKSQLYTNLTHEFRTPLTVILGMARQMRDNPNSDVSRNLDMVIDNGRSLLDMVNQMLNLSRLESGKMTLKVRQGDIILFLQSLIDSFRSFMSSKDIQLHFLPEVAEVVMDFDSDKTKQILSNLLSNAFKFTPKGGNVYVGIKVVDSSLTLQVKDTGKGIPASDLEYVFDRFYQVDNTTTRNYEGSGIGLALTKELVTLMGGSISVQSPPAGVKTGAEFTVVLPIHNDAPLEEIAKGSSQLNVPAEPVIGSSQPMDKLVDRLVVKNNLDVGEKPLVLIAEDNEDVASYVSSCLYNDYRLAIAKNGQEGLELAIELIPDIIVSDVMMPIMDGFEFCRKVKEDSRTNHIPVVILTARADFDSKLEGLELGANAYIPKPFEEQELLFTVKNLLDLRNNQHHHYRSGVEVEVKHQAEEESEIVTKKVLVEDTFVIAVREHIERQLDNANLSVEQLARELHLSHSQFGRKLNALTGLSPNKFIRATRLNKAKVLLMDAANTITEVSYACGFNDPSYFTRVFKKEFGKSPQEWRGDVTSHDK